MGKLTWIRYDERGREIARGVLPLHPATTREYADAWAARLNAAAGGCIVWAVVE
jgi:hypothetical protein